MLTIERCHIESALRGIARQRGRELPLLEHLSYRELVDRYYASCYDCIPFTDEEIEKLEQEVHEPLAL